MAWQKTKILLVSTEINPETDKKIVHRYVTTKSKGAGKPKMEKLKLKKYNPILRKHTVYTETKYK